MTDEQVVPPGDDVDQDELAAFRAWQQRNASPEAVALTEAGAAPTNVDANEMLAQIQALQEQMAALRASAGIPGDPIEAHVMALRAHVKAQADANPHYDFSELQKALEDLPEPKSLTTDDTDLVKSTVEDTTRRFGHIRHELGYVEELARGLHIEVLKARKSASGKPKVAA